MRGGPQIPVTAVPLPSLHSVSSGVGIPAEEHDKVTSTIISHRVAKSAAGTQCQGRCSPSRSVPQPSVSQVEAAAEKHRLAVFAVISHRAIGASTRACVRYVNPTRAIPLPGISQVGRGIAAEKHRFAAYAVISHRVVLTGSRTQWRKDLLPCPGAGASQRRYWCRSPSRSSRSRHRSQSRWGCGGSGSG